MAALLTACGGFLLGVLWMDLLFDVQIVGGDPQTAVASIVAYYRRVTTQAYPMNRLIAAIMLVTVGATIVALLRRRFSPRLGLPALGLAAVPIGMAILRVFPNAVRLGSGVDPLDTQLALARAICFDHLLCLGLLAGFVALMIASSLRTPPAV
jgi:hypothetical protein